MRPDNFSNAKSEQRKSNSKLFQGNTSKFGFGKSIQMSINKSKSLTRSMSVDDVTKISQNRSPVFSGKSKFLKEFH